MGFLGKVAMERDFRVKHEVFWPSKMIFGLKMGFGGNEHAKALLGLKWDFGGKWVCKGTFGLKMGFWGKWACKGTFGE